MSKKEERTTCLVPSKMLPNKQFFLDLDFTFREIGDTDLCLATLPEGWRSVAGKDAWVGLIDEKGRKRGYYIYAQNAPILINLHPRFYISVDEDPDNKIYSCFSFLRIFVKDRVTKKAIFDAGICDSKDQAEKNQLINKCRSFLNDRYPDWENSTKYWNW